ncbi:DUF192 domain-containing protein [Ideonella sp. 4Y16]|uniref:DUF192 domain-containing protein n=1 Tax=Ideonella alba TaxID=2824118 RepID=UPI001B3798F2|nr:DUF192 domain-containing protein [Ideonella alba]MBQ0945571.1 DUF192 domain-containing protein [Ideonella alba]
MGPAQALWIDGRDSGCRVGLANRWRSRAIGLLATRQLDRLDGLWLSPCAAVHMVGMAYALDIVFLDRSGGVLRVVPGLRPWAAAVCRGAHQTLELRAGLAVDLAIRSGSRLALSAPPPAPSAAPPVPAPAR